ncbi:mitochondrial dicarboxylate carrier-like [Paramacrobiotus metropolitanus]|uniref:mitochondrial dicarboxylate carrier-like n=1 Tax=Paramacrobiotus metropolitanus TaxID=2943436 RepID=UPI0024464396|nr:mitochondrial dicarboxylate carrier-like [Paramacrobiotus metropolitanus]
MWWWRPWCVWRSFHLFPLPDISGPGIRNPAGCEENSMSAIHSSSMRAFADADRRGKFVARTAGPPTQITRKARWYFGGLASTMAVSITHPLDLLKVYLQTQEQGRLKMIPSAVHIVKTQGVLALYNGISASVLRQLTHTTARFGMYEMMKPADPHRPHSFPYKVLTAGVSGAFGGFVGAPADLVNVRMQNDVKLPLEERRNYKNGLDGLIRVCREEGFLRLWRGSSMVMVRAVFITIGQLSFYDQVKQMLLHLGFADSVPTHLLSSSVAAMASTTVSAPFDVVKTRMQNNCDRYRNLRHCFSETARTGGVRAFFQGYLPAFIRIGPQTILMFLLYEQLRLHFGIHIPIRTDTEAAA